LKPGKLEDVEWLERPAVYSLKLNLERGKDQYECTYELKEFKKFKMPLKPKMGTIEDLLRLAKEK
jgi:hypothetical protein